MNIPENLADTSVTISELLLFMGKTHESLTYLEEAEKVAMANDLVDMQLKVFNVYSQYYQKIKDYPKAIEYLNKYIKKNKENQLRINEEKIAVLEAKYKTEIYKYKNKDLSKKNKAMQKQIRDLSGSLNELQQTHEKLKTEFQENAEKINKQDSLISSQARMAVMGEMISAIAHQWKQPLNVIWLLAQAIGDAWDYKEIDDEFMENQLSLIEDQVKYMNNTITDFRNFFKQDYYTEFNIADTVKKAVTLVRYILDKENIAIIEDIDNSCTISGNPNELNQVIINIINNAKDAILSSNTKNPEIKISLNCSDDDIQLKIYNNGEKIKQDHLSKIFEPYFTTKEKTGTGIGLHICKKIIEHKFKGNISVRNTETGVEFKITMKNK